MIKTLLLGRISGNSITLFCSVKISTVVNVFSQHIMAMNSNPSDIIVVYATVWNSGIILKGVTVWVVTSAFFKNSPKIKDIISRQYPIKCPYFKS